MDGSTPPPAGSPNFYVGSQDNNGPYGAPFDALNLYRFPADFTIPANSTFTLAATIPVAPFNSILGLCAGSRACIPQPGTAIKIDHLGYRQRPLFRLAYRNFGDHEALVTNQSVSAGKAQRRSLGHPLVGNPQPQWCADDFPAGHLCAWTNGWNPSLDGKHRDG